MRRILTWFWWLMIGGSTIIRALGTPADLNSVDESRSWWLESWNWAITSDAFWWAILALLAIGMFALQIAPKLPSWFASFWHNKELYSKLMQEHDDNASDRMEYWKILKAVYNSHDTPYSKLEHLIEASDSPIIDLRHPDIKAWSSSLSGPSKELWEFVIWAQSCFEPEENEIMNLQSKFSNYWQKIGAAIFDEKQISKNKTFDRDFPHQSRLLKLVLYMELCVELDLESTKIRKPYAYILYEEAKRLGLTYERDRATDGMR